MHLFCVMIDLHVWQVKGAWVMHRYFTISCYLNALLCRALIDYCTCITESRREKCLSVLSCKYLINNCSIMKYLILCFFWFWKTCICYLKVLNACIRIWVQIIWSWNQTEKGRRGGINNSRIFRFDNSYTEVDRLYNQISFFLCSDLAKPVNTYGKMNLPMNWDLMFCLGQLKISDGRWRLILRLEVPHFSMLTFLHWFDFWTFSSLGLKIMIWSFAYILSLMSYTSDWIF